MRREFRMPDAGEGLTEAEVLAWRVAPGDVVEVNQVLLEIETAKAAVELPSPYAGTVLELLVSEGQVVAVGEPIIAIDEGVAADAVGASTSPPVPAPAPTPTPSPDNSWASGASSPTLLTSSGTGEREPAAEVAGAQTAAAFGTPTPAAPPTDNSWASGPSSPTSLTSSGTGDREPAAAGQAGAGTEEPRREAVLVGYGVRTGGTPRRRPRLGPHGVARPEPGPPGAAAKPVRHGGLEQARAVEQRLTEGGPRAKPPVRRLARDLGVDLGDVVPTGPHGSITHDDVTRAAGRPLARAGAALSTPAIDVGARGTPGSEPPSGAGAGAAGGLGSAAVGAAPSLGGGDDADRIPLSHVARMMARAMTESAFTAPHVTEWVDVDVTATTRLVAAARAHPGWTARTITPLTVAALALVRAAREFPHINASLDGDDLLVHRHVHLGVAVDSPRGLIVPHVPNAETLTLAGMAEALAALIGTARAGRSRPDQLRGSTITITNVGVFGVDGGTPILNPGESAILAMGRVLPRPWVVDGVVTVRDVVTLALSFDHRVVDGALGSRVLRRVADFLEDPGTALVLG